MATNFQLFKTIPNKEFIEKIAFLFGIKKLSPNYKFTLKDLERNKTVEKLYSCENEFKNYYINCKFIKYFDDLNEKKSITILRHFLKIINYKIISKEKYSNNTKYLLYEIIDANISYGENDFNVSFD